jgi:hypothetical protein
VKQYRKREENVKRRCIVERGSEGYGKRGNRVGRQQRLRENKKKKGGK